MKDEKTRTCTQCKGELEYLGQVPIRAKGTSGTMKLFFGEWAELGEEMWPIDIFRCTDCGHLELYDLDFSLKKQ